MDSPIARSPELWHLFTNCLLMADHKPYRAIFAGKEEEFGAGSFLTGRFALADRLGCSPSTAWGRLLKLQSLGMLALKSDNKRTLVSICKWESYQGASDISPTPSRQPADNNPTLPKEPKKERMEELGIPLTGEKPAASKSRKKLEDSSSPTHQLLGFFAEEFKRRTGEEHPPFNWGRDGKIAKRMLAVYPIEKMKHLIVAMWDSPDPFIQSAGKTVGLLASVLPKLLAGSQASAQEPVASKRTPEEEALYLKRLDWEDEARNTLEISPPGVSLRGEALWPDPDKRAYAVEFYRKRGEEPWWFKPEERAPTGKETPANGIVGTGADDGKLFGDDMPDFFDAAGKPHWYDKDAEAKHNGVLSHGN